MTDGIQRRLAAILVADVAGYSRLMGEDEAGTLSALRQLRTELFAPTVDDHNGTIVKSMGRLASRIRLSRRCGHLLD